MKYINGRQVFQIETTLKKSGIEFLQAETSPLKNHPTHRLSRMDTYDLSSRILDAARNGAENELKTYLQNLPSEFTRATLNSAAVLAILNDRVETLKALLDSGVSPAGVDERDRTFVRLAALKDALACLELLHQRGALLHEPGYSPLHAACHGGNPRVVSYLLAHGVPLDCKNMDRDQPAHIAARQVALGCLEVLRAAKANFHTENLRQESPLSLLLTLSEKEPSAARYLSGILKTPGSNSSTDTPVVSGESSVEFDRLLMWARSDINRLALIIRHCPLTEATARKLIESPNFHKNHHNPGFVRAYHFDFDALLNNTQAPGVGRRILDKTPFNELFHWASPHPARLSYIAEHVALDFDAVRRLISHREFLAGHGVKPDGFEHSSLQANPSAKGLVERFFTETPLADLIQWVGNSSRRLKFLSEQVEIPYEAWRDYLEQNLFDVDFIQFCGGELAISRFLQEMPSPYLLQWGGDDETRIVLLLMRARLDEAAWARLITKPALTVQRPGIRIKYDPRPVLPLPPLINYALKNPNLPPNIRDIINVSLA